MRRLLIASALGLGLLATTGLGGTASAMPLGVQTPMAAAASDADLLMAVQYRRPHGHHYQRRHYTHRPHYMHRPHYAHRRHYAPPRHHHRAWRR